MVLPRLPANRLLVGLVLCLVVFAGVVLLIHDRIQRDVYSDLAIQESALLDGKSELLSQHLDTARRQATFLGNVPPISGIIRALENNGVDPSSGSPLSVWKERLAEIFHAYITTKPNIRQLRYIRFEDGQELVRVEQRSGGVSVVPDNQLQGKKGRAYFQAIESLGMGATYISPIELNREYGEVEHPAWPTYRAAFNVVTETEHPFGFVVINYDASSVLEALAKGSDTSFTLVMNGKNQFLAHPDEDLVFAHEYGLPGGWGSTFDSDFKYNSQQFTEVQSAYFGQVYYLSRRAVVRSAGIDNQLYLISVVQKSTIERLIAERLWISILGLGALLVVAFLIIVSYHRAFQERSRRSALDSQYKAIFNRSKDAIFLFNDQGEVISANPSACRLLKLSEAAISGTFLYELLDGENRHLSQFILDFLEGEEESSIECSFALRGESLELVVTLVRIGMSFHGRDLSVALINDVTDIKRANKLIESHNEELRREVNEQTKELKRLLKEAQSATEAKGRFLAAMSHEIRTPMNGVFGMLSLIRRDALTSRQEKNLDLAESSVKALTSLINDILDLSKIEAGRLQLENASFDLSRLIHSCASSNSILLGEKAVTLLVDLVEVKHAWVEADANRIRQVLNNLVSNAIKFTSSGEIRIHARTSAPVNGYTELTCSVSDSGIGISAEKVDDLFHSFVQETSSTAREYGGTGLGLAICKHLCELMGGHIRAVSQKGEGSTFTFTLPLRCEEERSRNAAIRFAQREVVWVALNDTRQAELLVDTMGAWGHQALSMSLPEALRALDQTEDPDCSIVILSDAAIQKAKQCLSRLPYEVKVVFASEKVGLLHDEEAIRLLPPQAGHVDQPLSAVSLADALHALDPERFRVNESRSTKKTWRPKTGWLDGKSLLVVDDHRVNREVLSGLLESSGAKVLVACDADEAIALLRGTAQGHVIDLLLLDCQMPGMDGYELTRQIRSGAVSEACRDVTIIAVTAAAMSNERQRCFDVGMDGYLSKPIEPSELYRTLWDWLVSAPIPTASADVALEDRGNTRPPPSEAVWDRAVALANVANMEPLLEQVIETYLDTAPASVRSIRDAFDERDLERVRLAAHSLKGASGNIGAVQMESLTKSIEALAHTGETEGLAQLVDALPGALASLSKALGSERRGGSG